MRSDLQFGQATRRGNSRAVNADRVAIYEPDDDVHLHRHGRVVVIADGSRSRIAGTMAADLAIQSVFARFERGAPRESGPLLSAAVTDAHQIIAAHAASGVDLHGLSAAMCAAILRADRIHVTAIGDVHAWRVRGKDLDCLTEGRDAHAALGSEQGLDLSIRTTDIQARDVFLFATDGFHRAQKVDLVLRAVRSIPDIHRACQHVIRELDSHAPPDDATLAMLRVVRLRAAPSDS